MRRILLAVAVVVLLAGVTSAEGRISTKQEREDCVKLVKKLEVDPLYEKADLVRGLLAKLLQEAEDIEVVVDLGMIAPVSNSGKEEEHKLIVEVQFYLAVGSTP